ncbi:Beta-galactosidase [Cucumis melo var. makuwa]|uniref:Beta-galactosidase n=1 Tax=Cucumis melo var. makuwa TaxID=1194695 RepID=A0A5A7U3E1_CUCMM|nr:Beta-galactosidase [Cucumis melo var. makuwa]TYK20759.1 Beta-galactosidase [Cucumis melo var. makuwa]
MEPQISKPLLFAATAKDIWDTTRTLYSKRQNVSPLYTLRKHIHECKQGAMDVTSFFNKLSLIWQEMDLCRELVWRDPTDGLQYSRIEEVDRIYDFLVGLNPKFDVVRGHILERGPLPVAMTSTMENQFLSMSIAKKQWHTKEQCWKLHGSPSGGKKRPSNDKQNIGRAYVSESAGPSQPPDSHRNQIDHNPTTFGVIVQLDGSMAPIAGKEKISPCAGIFLNNVLHDLSSRKMIGTARHSRELYLLDDDTSSSSISRTSLLSLYFTTSEQDCMLWHFRLGHPNFQYTKHLFPHLFPKIDVSTLSCNLCLRAKQHRVSFPSQSYKPTHPSTLVHSDVSRPSKITTSSRKRWFVTFIDDHTRLT